MDESLISSELHLASLAFMSMLFCFFFIHVEVIVQACCKGKMCPVSFCFILRIQKQSHMRSYIGAR